MSMRCHMSGRFAIFATLLFAGSVAYSQERVGVPVLPAPQPNPPPPAVDISTSIPADAGGGFRFFDRGRPNDFLVGTRDFPNFIGFLSNPIESIDPRAVTEIYPVFGSAWANGNGPLQSRAELQLYGAGITVALSDRLAV